LSSHQDQMDSHVIIWVFCWFAERADSAAGLVWCQLQSWPICFGRHCAVRPRWSIWSASAAWCLTPKICFSGYHLLQQRGVSISH